MSYLLEHVSYQGLQHTDRSVLFLSNKHEVINAVVRCDAPWDVYMDQISLNYTMIEDRRVNKSLRNSCK